jgi:hypothetical protein
VRTAVEAAGYASACSVRPGMSGPADDRFALHRVPINGTDSISVFKRKLSQTTVERIFARFSF